MEAEVLRVLAGIPSSRCRLLHHDPPGWPRAAAPARRRGARRLRPRRVRGHLFAALFGGGAARRRGAVPARLRERRRGPRPARRGPEARARRRRLRTVRVAAFVRRGGGARAAGGARRVSPAGRRGRFVRTPLLGRAPAGVVLPARAGALRGALLRFL